MGEEVGRSPQMEPPPLSTVQYKFWTCTCTCTVLSGGIFRSAQWSRPRQYQASRRHARDSLWCREGIEVGCLLVVVHVPVQASQVRVTVGIDVVKARFQRFPQIHHAVSLPAAMWSVGAPACISSYLIECTASCGRLRNKTTAHGCDVSSST